MKKNKKFIQPTSFEVILIHQDKKVLIPIVKWLLKNGHHTFQWDYGMTEITGEHRLAIQTSWADNLAKIAKLLGDYKQD